jgi:hypothetical protein
LDNTQAVLRRKIILHSSSFSVGPALLGTSLFSILLIGSLQAKFRAPFAPIGIDSCFRFE